MEGWAWPSCWSLVGGGGFILRVSGCVEGGVWGAADVLGVFGELSIRRAGKPGALSLDMVDISRGRSVGCRITGDCVSGVGRGLLFCLAVTAGMFDGGTYLWTCGGGRGAVGWVGLLDAFLVSLIRRSIRCLE